MKYKITTAFAQVLEGEVCTNLDLAIQYIKNLFELDDIFVKQEGIDYFCYEDAKDETLKEGYLGRITRVG